MKKPTFYCRLLLAALLFLLVLSEDNAFGTLLNPGGPQPITYTTITYTFAPAPQLPGDEISSAGPVQTDDQGNVAMWGEFNPTNVGNFTEALWVGSVGNQKLAAAANQPAPGTASGVLFGSGNSSFTYMGSFSESPTGGFIVFSSELYGSGVTSSNDFGLWSGTAGNIQLDARIGSSAPGTTAKFAGLSQVGSVNSTGVVAFEGTIAGSGITQDANDDCVWEGKPGSLQLVAQSGNFAPGAPAGTTFAYFGGEAFTEPQINDAGTIAFTAGLSGAQVDGGSNTGIYIGNQNSLQLVAAANGTAPGTGGAHFASFHVSINGNYDYLEPILDDQDDLAFRSVLFGGGTTSANNIGIFAWTNNSLQLVVRAGSAAPGVSNATFSSTTNSFETFGQPALSDGKIAFQAGLKGTGISATNEIGIWAGSLESLHLVAQAGNQAPGTPAGVLFGNGNDEEYFSDPEINALGEVAFTSALQGPGVDNSNFMGLWATDPNGNLDLIMRDGDQYDLNGTDKSISGISIVNDLDQNGTNTDALNDNGQLSVVVSFTDNTQALILVQLPVPEPSGLVLLAIGASVLIGLAIRRRSKCRSALAPLGPSDGLRAPRRQRVVNHWPVLFPGKCKERQ